MHLWDLLSPWFSASDKFSPTAGGAPTPATIFPLLGEDHVNNHISLGVPPPEHGYANPVSSRGHPLQIRRYRALHPGKLSARSSRGLVLVPDQLSVRSSQGHPSQIRRYRALHHGQLSAVSSWGHPSQSRRYRALHPGQLSTRSSRGHTPRTRSTLRRVIATLHPRFCLVFRSLFLLV